MGTVFLPWKLAFAEEYKLDLSEIDKKPYHLGGYLEFRPVLIGLDRKAALYQVKFYNQDVGNPLDETNGKLQLEGSLEKGISRLFARVNTDVQNSYQGWTEKTTLYEGFLSVKPSSVPGPGGRQKNLEVGEGLCLESGGLSRPAQESGRPGPGPGGFHRNHSRLYQELCRSA